MGVVLNESDNEWADLFLIAFRRANLSPYDNAIKEYCIDTNFSIWDEHPPPPFHSSYVLALQKKDLFLTTLIVSNSNMINQSIMKACLTALHLVQTCDF